MNHEGASISRATSVSRASKQGSTMSRSQSLIKKNIAPHDLRPSDILIERFVAWKAIVKQLIACFESIADIHNNTVKELTKLGAVIQVPFRAGNQFLGEGGLQDIYYDVRDKTRSIADQHANLGRTIDKIKAHIKNVQNDTGKLATVAKERELSTRLISDLASGISNFKNTPRAVTSKTDPYVANAAVVRQLTKQVHEENLLQKSIIIMQQNSAHFEEGIVRAIQSARQTYDEWQARMGASIASTHTDLNAHWLAFSGRSDHLLDPEMPLRNPMTVMYPSNDDPSVLPVHTGLMERKKRYTKTYRESFFVLTARSMAPNGREPLFSLFLPMCTLGPPSGASVKLHKFHIEGRKDGSGTTKGGSVLRSLSIGRLGGSDHAWSYRARSREDIMEWWNDIRMLCARYLVASEQMERSGPVAAATRAAGYVSEDEEEEGETDDEGSSVEEEEDGDLDYVSRRIGANGYPIEKKGHGRQPSQGDGANLSRRPSKRQQEKAPEGKPPHAAGEDGAAAPAAKDESRFVENV
ncbi:PH domain-containing protein [Favolaschia claudopus]|uniref:PH domain-containing protein n=1 Tax=Favolaschia claudopus TaxID=2862362 RepID=A0AAV9Z3D5_9AGAR